MISVIIVSYNVRHFLRQCLESLASAAEGLEVEVLVVDNASADDTPAYLRRVLAHYPLPLKLVENRRNVGFSRANNQALPLCRGEWVLYLNPDTLLTPDTLRCCLDFARERPQLGAMGVRMLSDGGRFAPESRRSLPTPWVSFCKMSGLTALFPRSRRLGRYYMGYLPEDQPAQVEILSGAYMMVRRAALEQVEAFDEVFFMYGEDIDLSYRLLQGGWQNWYVPTPILHYKGESTKRGSWRYVHTFYTAMLIFFRKHFRHCWWLSPAVRLAIVAQATLALLRGWARAFSRWLRPDVRRSEPLYVYVGTHAERFAALCERWGVEADVSHALPATPLGVETLLRVRTRPAPRPVDALRGRPGAPVCIVVDEDVMPPAQTLLLFCRERPERCFLGTYNPRLDVLLSGGGALD